MSVSVNFSTCKDKSAIFGSQKALRNYLFELSCEISLFLGSNKSEKSWMMILIIIV